MDTQEIFLHIALSSDYHIKKKKRNERVVLREGEGGREEKRRD